MLLAKIKVWSLSLLASLLSISCAKENSCENCREASTTAGNSPPVANGGADQLVSMQMKEIILNGSNSTDADNNITSYSWTQVSGPSSVSIANPNAIQTAVRNFIAGTYQFELKVTDAGGLFSKDSQLVVVNSSDEINVRWTQLQSLQPGDFLLGSNHINFLVGIRDQLFAVSKNGDFWYYNARTSEWSDKGKIPTGMEASNYSVVFSINDVGYFIGNGTCRQYNVITGQWTTKYNAPVGAEHVDYSVPLVIGNKAFLVGSTNKLVTMYDPANNTYSQKGRFPDEGPVTGFVINGVGYCIQKDGRCWKYDPPTDKWQQKASLPPAIFNMSGCTLNGYGYIIGDPNKTAYDHGGTLKLWRYTPSSDQWKQIEEDYRGQAAYEVRTVSLDGIVYVGLGYTRDDSDAIDFWSFK